MLRKPPKKGPSVSLAKRDRRRRKTKVKMYEPRDLLDPAVRRKVGAEKLARILQPDDDSKKESPGVVEF